MAGILMEDKTNLLIKYKRRIHPCQAPSKNRTFVNRSYEKSVIYWN